jgi:hypothetical protein
MDTNQFANSGGGGTTSTQAPAQITTPVNGVAAMIKAMMDGNDSFKQQQGNLPALAAGSPVPGAGGPTAVGGPSGPSPLPGATNPVGMTGGFAGMPQQGAMGMVGGGASPFTQGGSPISVDPVTQALMSQIPSMGNG